MAFVFGTLFFGGSKNKYGNRLDGIENVKIDNDRLVSLASSLEENEKVEVAKCHLQGKIVYIEMTLVDSTSKDNAKEIANSTLSEFSEEEINFYDFEYLLKWKANEEDEDSTDTVIGGTKHPYVDSMTWTRN